MNFWKYEKNKLKEDIKNNNSSNEINKDIGQDRQLKNNNRIEKLEELKDKINKYKELKVKELKEERVAEKSIKPSEQVNKIINKLGELPSFEERERTPGYSIDTNTNEEVPDYVIRTLITKFLNQRFCKKDTDLNNRSNSIEKEEGFYKWEIKDVIKHLKTHQVTKVLTDKYGYQYSYGKNENIPLSFYFDMSGSMHEYTGLLAVIAIELLKKNVKVLIGFNERVNIQIDSIDSITIKELAKELEKAIYIPTPYNEGYRYIKNKKINYKIINQNIDKYLIEKEAEKCVIFSDFDPRNEIIELSKKVKTYWFCFEKNVKRYSISKFNGFIYCVNDIKDIENGLIKINNKRFETLVFTDNPEKLQKK